MAGKSHRVTKLAGLLMYGITRRLNGRCKGSTGTMCPASPRKEVTG